MNNRTQKFHIRFDYPREFISKWKWAIYYWKYRGALIDENGFRILGVCFIWTYNGWTDLFKHNVE